MASKAVGRALRVFGTFAIWISFVSCCSAQIMVNFDEQGVLRELRYNGAVLAQNFAAVIVKPGWQGSYADQLNPSTVKAIRKQNDKMIWQGVLHGDGVSVNFLQTAIVNGNEVILTHDFQPKNEVITENLILRCFLPTEGNAGKAKWVAVDEFGFEFLEGIFPPTLPERYHLLSRGSIYWLMWVLPSGYALLFDLRESGLLSLNLQDNRRFSINAFELQICLIRGKWQVGERVASKLRLQVMSASEAAEWEKKMREFVERQRSVVLQERAPLQLKSVKPGAKSLRRYETLEIKIDLDATYDNPFDPEQISVEAEIVSPSGKRLQVSGFFTQDYERVKRGTGQWASEILRKTGEPYFAVRFTPTEVGTYRYKVIVTGRGIGDEGREKKQISSDWFTLQVLPNPQAKGFVRRGKFWHLQLDDGTPF